jgi:hypothetical protein
MLEASLKLGLPLNSAETVKQVIEDAGYVDVVEVIYKWPMNGWPADKKMKEIGMWSYFEVGNGHGALISSCSRIRALKLMLTGLWTYEATTSNLGGMSVALFTRALNWSTEELEVLLVDVRKDMKNSKIHSYWPMWVLYHSLHLLRIGMLGMNK